MCDNYLSEHLLHFPPTKRFFFFLRVACVISEKNIQMEIFAQGHERRAEVAFAEGPRRAEEADNRVYPVLQGPEEGRVGSATVAFLKFNEFYKISERFADHGCHQDDRPRVEGDAQGKAAGSSSAFRGMSSFCSSTPSAPRRTRSATPKEMEAYNQRKAKEEDESPVCRPRAASPSLTLL